VQCGGLDIKMTQWAHNVYVEL